MNFKNMSADEVLRMAEPSTELERRLLEILDDYEDWHNISEAAGIEIDDLETQVATRDQQIQILERKHAEQAEVTGKLRYALSRLLLSVVSPPEKQKNRVDAIAEASQALADTQQQPF